MDQVLTSLQSENNLEHPPQRQVRKKLERSSRVKTRENAAAIELEWIADGLTAESFWIAPQHLIAALEGRPEVFIALANPIESE